MIQEHLRPSARVARVCVVGDACVGFSRVAEGLGPRLAALKQAAAQLAVLAAKTAELEVAEVDVALKNDALLVTELRACPPLTKAAAEAVVALAEQRAALRA